MADYNYLVLNRDGKEERGTIKAENQNYAMQKLKADGYIPIEVKEAGALNKSMGFDFAGKVKPRDLSVFCRQFVAMLNAGVSVIEALRMLTESTENKKLRQGLTVVQQDIEKGESMNASMRRQPNVFPELMANMVGAGEASGKLDVAFERMGTHFEKAAKTSAMIKKAMIYPVVILVVAVIVVIVMLAKVVPLYMGMFEEMDIELPGITQALISMSDFMQVYWWAVILVIVGIVIGGNLFFKTDTGKHFKGRFLIGFPLIKNLNIKSSCSLFARTLSTLIYSGLPLVEALTLTAQTMENVIYKDMLNEAVKDIKQGIPLSIPLKKSSLYPSMVGHMVAIGEETGDIEQMLTKMADYYDEEVEMAVQSTMAAMEPMIIVLMAGIVGFIIAGVMSPMLAMYDGLGGM